MPSRYRRARLDEDDPRIRIRTRYMEAIRAGAAIDEATRYANADPSDIPIFTKTAPIRETPIESKGYGKPGEQSQLLPRGWAEGDVPTPRAIDPESESFKRPVIDTGEAQKVAAPDRPISADVETPPVIEAPKVARKRPPPLPADWDSKDFPWPKLRALCMALGLAAPANRTEAVRVIRAHMDGDDPPVTLTPQTEPAHVAA